MTASYRMLLFSPDPFSGATFPLAAIVRDEGRVRVVKAIHLPGVECLGRRDLAVALRRLHSRLDSIEGADVLPPAFGPYTSLSEPRAVPAGAEPVAWLERLFARDPVGVDDREIRGPHRSSIGHRFFETWHVGKYVRKTFHAASDWDGWLAPHAAGLEQVSHWVAGSRELVLMEPIVPTRGQFDKDLKEVVTRFMAYRWAFDQASAGEREGRLLAYVTAGGPERRRQQVIEALRGCASEVVDTEDETARSRLVALVRRVGAEGNPQAHLHVAH